MCWLDQSRSAASTELLERRRVFTRAAALTSSDQIASQIDAGKALMVISIPADSRTGWGRQRALLSSWTAVDVAGGGCYLASIVRRLQRARHGAQALAPTARLVQPQPESRWTLMPGLIAALSMLQTLLLAALSVREREQGHLRPALVTPLTPMQILIGVRHPGD